MPNLKDIIVKNTYFRDDCSSIAASCRDILRWINFCLLKNQESLIVGDIWQGIRNYSGCIQDVLWLDAGTGVKTKEICKNCIVLLLYYITSIFELHFCI